MKFRSLPVAAAAALLAAMSGVAGQLPARAATAAIPTTPSGTYFTINNGPGDQTDPHVSGDWVSYTDNSAGYYQVRYHNLATGQDSVIPSNGGQDLLSGISGTTIVYMHSTANGQSIFTYDIGSGAQADVDPTPGSVREFPAIGGRTVAWVDYTADPSHPQIVVENLDTQQVTALTQDTTLLNLEPSVSADGSVVAWAKCTGSFSGCNAWDAVLGSGGSWTIHQLTSDNATELPHSDGQIVAYDSTRNGEQDIYWQPVSGGAEQNIAFPGPDKNPHISGNLIVFDHFDTTASTPNWDVYAYSLATQTLYRITDTLTNETLSDVSVTPDGVARVVWNVLESDYNVYAFEFQPLAAAAVASISPPSGPLAGGTTVTVTGSGFTGATAVSFGSTAASSFTVNSDTSITATAPAATSVGPVDVTVTTPAGTSAASAGDRYSYIYAFTGFLAPVGNPPAINLVNAGQAIPIQFSLGGDFGLGILAAGSPTVQQISCATGVPVNTSTETDTAGSSGLQYNATTGTYTYVWKTSKASRGTCQVFTLGLNDGTVHTANFQYVN